ncbi:MAG: EAL domain-containing protein [Spirulina sp. SIO3F2]|nr:EAL domain-containing protein [Spirulina sp. SIO3F2]
MGVVMGLWQKLHSQSDELGALRQKVKRSQPHDSLLEQFFHQSLDLLCVANFQGYLIQINPAWVKTLGYSSEQLCQTPFLTFVHPDDHAKTQAEFEQLKAGQPTIHFENRYRHQEGHYLTFAWMAWPCFETQTIQAIARDVTTQKQQQQRFLETLPDLIFHVDRQGRILSYKPSKVLKTHVPPTEFLGKTVTDVMPEAVSSVLLQGIEQTLKTQTLQTVEYQLTQTVESQVKSHDYEARLVYYCEDEVLAVVRDITATKQIRRDRLQTQTQLQARIQQQAAVAQMGQAALSCSGLDSFMTQVCEQLCHVLTVDYAQILELLPNGQALLLRAGAGWRDGLVGNATITAGRYSQAGYTLLLAEPVVVEDLRTETRFSGTSMLHNHRVVAGVSVIIPGSDNEPFGVLAAHACQERSFTQDDINFLQAVAHVLATAIARQAADERLRVLERAVEASKNGIILTDATQYDNPVVYVNPAFEAMTGYSAAEMIGQNCRILQGSETDLAELKRLRQAIDEVQDCSVKLRNYRKDGTAFWNELYVAPIFSERGHLTHFVGIQNDITQRYQAELALQASEEKYRRIVETTTEGIWIVNQSGQTSFVNQQMAQMLGYSPKAMLGKTFLDFMEEADQIRACQELAQPLTDPPQSYHDLCFHCQNGQALWARLSVSALFEDDQTYIGALAMVTNITDRKQAEDQLEYQAFYDSLTALPNRNLFLETLYQAMQQAQVDSAKRFAVGFLDLDNFKMVNDGLGHAAGDKLLVAIAYRLRQCLRPQDMLARLGGDEFAILLADLAADDQSSESAYADLALIMQTIHQSFNSPFQFGDYEIVSSISLGIAIYEPTYTMPEELLRDADTAMYRAKSQGKGQYAIFDQQMRQEVLDHLYLEHELRKAIDNQEFALYYQPIVSLQSGHLDGFEALIRWFHPEHGLIRPDQFIPIAEETGLILAIGEWVLRAAFEQMTQWYQQDPRVESLTLNINLSTQQFAQSSLVSQLESYLARTPLPARCFKLEITESVVMEEAQTAERILKQLKEKGFQLCIDDFGTGYSSLSYLHRFPVDTLKVDRSFVQRLETHYEDAQITQAIVALAHNLKMNVVAEGIERLEQIKYLQPLGCEQGQGFFFAKPFPAEVAAQLIADSDQLPWQQFFVES